MIEKQVMRFIEDLRTQNPLPLRITLWDGSSAALSDDPRVELRLNGVRAARYLMNPSLDGLGQAFVEGLIDVHGDVGDVIDAAAGLARASGSEHWLGKLPTWLARHTRDSDRKAIEYHYDVSNEFYSLWLDPRMVYSCAYFPNGDEDLATAQRLKLDHICRKLMIEPGQTMLDIGCGWGALAIHAAREYGAKAVGITLSKNQYELANERVREAGLQDSVEIRLQDYRDVPGEASFDRISSVGMFEHVGRAQLPGYFGKIRRLLKPGGLLMNHGITAGGTQNDRLGAGLGDFIERNIVPGGELLHVSHVLRVM
ncbi:MAG: class I SAM-dependent methyltransferase, partial [Gammaproteobacteria bacterium]